MSEPVRRIKRIEIDTEVAVCPARGCWREFNPTKSNQIFCSGACCRRASRDRFHMERPAN